MSFGIKKGNVLHKVLNKYLTKITTIKRMLKMYEENEHSSPKPPNLREQANQRLIYDLWNIKLVPCNN